MALELIRQPWHFDVMVTENMFGDILSDLAAGLVGGMGMASCGEIGDDIGLFQLPTAQPLILWEQIKPIRWRRFYLQD